MKWTVAPSKNVEDRRGEGFPYKREILGSGLGQAWMAQQGSPGAKQLMKETVRSLVPGKKDPLAVSAERRLAPKGAIRRTD